MNKKEERERKKEAKEKNAIDFLVVGIIGVALVLIIIPEIIYVKDIYISSHHRANTMFKLTYQSFIMHSVILGFILIRVVTELKSWVWKKIFLFWSIFIWGACMVYPFYSIKGYYGALRTENYKGLWGLKFLKTLYPDDYAAFLWFKENVKEQVNILEAVGDSYTHYGRLSMATGLPTIQGWLVHEWLWRGSFDEPRERANEVQIIYETDNLQKTKELLYKYRVKYIVVGEMERKKYPNLKEEKFNQIGEKVFSSGKTRIYKFKI